MSIGDNIKRLRENEGLTQRELAEKIGISQSMLAQVERGTKAVTMALGKQIAECLNCRLEELY